jgi:hypothetical protein
MHRCQAQMLISSLKNTLQCYYDTHQQDETKETVPGAFLLSSDGVLDRRHGSWS